MHALGSTHARRMTLLLLLLACMAPAIQARRATTDVFCGQTSSDNGSTVSSSADAWLQPRANALTTRCNGVCGDDSLCVFRSEPLAAGCGGDQTSDGTIVGARCVNGPTCAYECIAVHAKATSWSVAWREAEDAPTIVTITMALASGEPTMTYVGGPIESLDALELPKTVTDLYVLAGEGHCTVLL